MESSLAFSSRALMKELSLHFLPLSHSASHSESWTDGWNFFSIFCLFSKFGTSEHSSEGLEGSFNCCRLLQLDRTLFTCLIHIHTLTELHTYVSTCCENSFAVKYFLILSNLRNKLNVKTFINTLSALAATCWLRARVEQICVD